MSDNLLRDMRQLIEEDLDKVAGNPEWFALTFQDWFAEGRERYIERCLYDELGNDRVLKRIGEYVKLSNLTVLELGCGYGGLAVAMAISSARVHAIDPLPENEGPNYVAVARMRAARLNVARRVNYVQGYGEHLPYQSASFDLVTTTSVLEHVADVRRVVTEVWRVLKAGGIWYNCCPNYLFPWEPHYHIPYIPFMPKMLFRAYVRVYLGWWRCRRIQRAQGVRLLELSKLLGQIDYINYTTYPSLVGLLHSVGFEVLPVPERIPSRRRKVISPLLDRVQRSGFGRELVKWVYPSIETVARKR